MTDRDNGCMIITPTMEIFGMLIDQLAKPTKPKLASIGWIGSPIYGRQQKIREKDKMKQQHI